VGGTPEPQAKGPAGLRRATVRRVPVRRTLYRPRTSETTGMWAASMRPHAMWGARAMPRQVQMA
jgi:hypothetical protein